MTGAREHIYAYIGVLWRGHPIKYARAGVTAAGRGVLYQKKMADAVDLLT